MKKFQIMTEMKNKAMLFDTADTDEQVDVFVDAFDDNKDLRSIKVYRFNEETKNYRMVYEDLRSPESRMVGFGRW